MGFVKVAEADKVEVGTGRVVEAGGKELALFNVAGEFFCIDNSCPHRDGPLGEGELYGEAVMCPYHAWQFSVRTGEGLYGCGVGVRTYATKVEDGDVLVEV